MGNRFVDTITASTVYLCPMKHKYTVEQLKEAVASSTSLTQALGKLGIIPAGGNFQTTRRRIAKHSIDTSHFTGKCWNKGRKFQPKRPLEDYLNNSVMICSDKLKKRLIKESVFVPKCYRCGFTEWQGTKIPLELEHINGNSSDNSLKNLTLLCPNCHALTATYRGRNKKRR